MTVLVKCIRCNESGKELLGIANVLMCRECIAVTVKEAVIKAEEAKKFVNKEDTELEVA